MVPPPPTLRLFVIRVVVLMRLTLIILMSLLQLPTLMDMIHSSGRSDHNESSDT